VPVSAASSRRSASDLSPLASAASSQASPSEPTLSETPRILRSPARRATRRLRPWVLETAPLERGVGLGHEGPGGDRQPCPPPHAGQPGDKVDDRPNIRVGFQGRPIIK